jgi:hypothetical protein
MFIGLASMCRRFSCLPGPGGLLEQDGYIMMGVGIAMDAIAEAEDKKQQDRHAHEMAKAAVGKK